MEFKLRVDRRGRITIPRAVRETLVIGKEVKLVVKGDIAFLSKSEDPFETFRETFKDLTFSREIRRIAKEEALKEALSRGFRGAGGNSFSVGA
jgi:bifunctional DNA-binding transcriptional regulator/antitoxin component of YhaV-PrlF toxin-antitoxin module